MMNSVSKPLEKPKRRLSVKSLLLRRLHILQWLPKYSKSDVISDFIAGLTVGLTMMPQSIAYANLAGLQAQYGLYTAFIGSFTYVFFGTIKEVSIGPTSLMALLTLTYTEGLGLDYMILLTFLVGCVEFLMGIFKLGFLVDFISPCVTSGFTSAMSVTIVTSQLKNLLGLRQLKNHGVFDVWIKIFQRYRQIQLADALLSLSCIVFLFAFKQLPKIKTRNPYLKKSFWFLSISKNAIVVLITSIIGFYFHEYCGGSPFNLSGAVPSGFPKIALPNLTTANGTVGIVEMVQTLGSGIIIVPIAAVMANVAIAKAFTSGTVVDATQEMMTLGLCNIFGAFVQAMPSCGAFTRSAVASNSGVRTPLQGIYSGTIILLALSFLTPYFYYIPRATLGAILVSAIVTMFDYQIFPKLWPYNKFDFFLTLITLVVGVVYRVEIGIFAGALINTIILLKVWTRPKISKEIRLDDKGQEYLYINPEIGLYYPAMDYLTSSIAKAHLTLPHLPIVLDCANLIKVDYAACQTINTLLKIYNNKNHRLTLLNISPKIFKILKGNVDLTNMRVCKTLENLHEDLHKDVEIPLLGFEKVMV